MALPAIVLECFVPDPTKDKDHKHMERVSAADFAGKRRWSRLQRLCSGVQPSSMSASADPP